MVKQLETRWKRLDRAMIAFMTVHGTRLLRLAPAVTFIWFGALKVVGHSPVADLVAQTVYWAPPAFFVPFLGWWEVVVSCNAGSGHGTGGAMTRIVARGEEQQSASRWHRWWSLGLIAVVAGGFVGAAYGRGLSAAGPAEVPIGEVAEHVHGLAVDPFNPQVLWIGTHGSLIRVRGGKEWTRIGSQRYDMMGFSVHPKEPNVLLTSGHPGPGDRRPNPLGVEISRDGGQSWRPLALAGQADFHTMTISRADPNRIYAWNVAGQTWGLYRSRDGGRAWDFLGDRSLQRVTYLAAHSKTAAVVLVGTDQGLFISEDAGANWRVYLSPQLLSVPVTALEVHPKNPQVIYAYAMRPNLGLIRSEDGGRQWTAVGLYLGERDAVGNLALDPTDPQVLYFATLGGNLYASRDGGRSRQLLVAGGRIVQK